jgi:hypothetical protein
MRSDANAYVTYDLPRAGGVARLANFYLLAITAVASARVPLLHQAPPPPAASRYKWAVVPGLDLLWLDVVR